MPSCTKIVYPPVKNCSYNYAIHAPKQVAIKALPCYTGSRSLSDNCDLSEENGYENLRGNDP